MRPHQAAKVNPLLSQSFQPPCHVHQRLQPMWTWRKRKLQGCKIQPHQSLEVKPLEQTVDVKAPLQATKVELEVPKESGS